MVWGGLFLSGCLSRSLHSLPAEIWRATTTVGDFEGRREERQKCDSLVTISLPTREREKKKSRERWMEAMKGTGEERCSTQRRDVRRGEELGGLRRIWENMDQDKLSARLYLHAIEECELLPAM